MIAAFRKIIATNMMFVKAVQIANSSSVLSFTVTQTELDAVVASAKLRRMSKQEREAQRVSFVWGNAPEGNQGTFDTVRKHLNLN